MQETFEQLVARVNLNSFIPSEDHTGGIMAKQVKLSKGKEFNFNVSKTGTTKYPWDEWFTGNLLMLEQSSGEADDKGTIVAIIEKRDYEVNTDAMPPKLKTAGRRRYKVVQVSRRDADGNKLVNALIIKARNMDTEEREAEDMLRAEEKAELVQRRKDKRAGASTNGTPVGSAVSDDDDDRDSEDAA